MKKHSLNKVAPFLMLLAALTGGAVMAQDTTATTTPMQVDMGATQEAAQPGDMSGAANGATTTLEDLTADPTTFFGQQVTLEGVVSNLVNPAALVLGEGVALDDDQVLVINTSGQPFDIRLTDGARFLVTGTVYPSFADGGVTQLIAALAESGMMPDTSMAGSGDASANAQATDVVGMFAYSSNLVDMVLPDDLFNHTILAVQNVEAMQLLELPQ
ncbi:MAG: hypothetical protein U0670_06495 [Anaerolineae bacterium]